MRRERILWYVEQGWVAASEQMRGQLSRLLRHDVISGEPPTYIVDDHGNIAAVPIHEDGQGVYAGELFVLPESFYVGILNVASPNELADLLTTEPSRKQVFPRLEEPFFWKAFCHEQASLKGLVDRHIAGELSLTDVNRIEVSLMDTVPMLMRATEWAAHLAAGGLKSGFSSLEDWMEEGSAIENFSVTVTVVFGLFTLCYLELASELFGEAPSRCRFCGRYLPWKPGSHRDRMCGKDENPECFRVRGALRQRRRRQVSR